ncbi:N-acetylmuramoyl-L-alanine amidase [Neobacillus soli]|uniref:N-acetylmuramoyl-L-alanine amidase n=1 Tax=Neobacillus soli TaxID=220688 RepID=UPI00082643A8|nr:N-acetylmuramoyl-L-alanine amidase [Neobacillus soli]
MKLYLDAGHGGQDSGAPGNGLNEKDVTLDIAQQIRKILLNDYENIDVKMSRTSDTTKSLGQRTSEANAWGADFFLAIHINSAESSAQGYEDYIYNGLSNSSASAKYQDIIHAEVIKLNQLKDRGKKKANFHVLRESSMPAMLSENGFISNASDAKLMKDPAWRQKVAQGHANGVAKAFNLKKKASTPVTPSKPTAPVKPNSPNTSNSKMIYTVYASSNKEKESATQQVAELSKKGIKSSIVTAKISGNTWYRVKIASFSSEDKAEQRLAEVKKAGFKDSFIIIEKDNSKPAKTDTKNSSTNTNQKESPQVNKTDTKDKSPSENTNKSPNNGAPDDKNTDKNNSPTSDKKNPPIIADPSQFSILGPTFLSSEQMNQFVKKVNPNAPELGKFYQTLGEYYGIRGDVAFAQAIHETDYFRFTGVVKPGQNNYSGIGATGPDVRGASFDTQEEGVLTQLQHLYAYATPKALPGQYPLVDPRFHLVDRGSAPTWTALNGKWAVPGKTYGQSILNLYGQMIHSTK